MLRRLLLCLGVLLAGIAHAAGPDLADAPTVPDLASCHGMKDLAFVGHMDDDLLFMNPDIESVIRDGGCVRVVYLTASERNEGEEYMLSRERGVQAAYAYMAGQPDDWIASTAQAGGHQVAAYTLRGRPGIQLWHMRLRDPWLGKGWGSLTPLSHAESVPGTPVDTLEATPQRYTRQELVDTLASIIRAYAPTTVRHLDDSIAVPYTQLCWRCPGHGHPDHIASARLVREAMRLAPGNYAQTAYQDYPIQEYASNLTADEIAGKTETFRRYAWVDYRYCQGPVNCRQPDGPAAAWVGRAYYVSRHDTGAMLAADPAQPHMPWLLTTGEQNDAVSIWHAAVGQWKMLGGRSSEAPAVAISRHGGASLLARDAVGRIWVKKQAADGLWSEWQAVPGARLTRLPAIAAEGAAAIALGTDERYYWSATDPASKGWREWAALPVLPTPDGNAAVALDEQARLTAAAVNMQGKLYLTRQASPQSTQWEAWRAVDAPPADTGLALIHDGQGRLTIYLRDKRDGRLWRMRKVETRAEAETAGGIGANAGTGAGAGAGAGATAYDAGWEPAQDLGLNTDTAPAAARDAQGRIAVAVRTAPDGALWMLQEGRRLKLADAVASAPALQNIEGKLYLTARLAGPAQRYQVWRQETNQQWLALSPTGEPPGDGGTAFQLPPAPAAQPPIVAGRLAAQP